MICSSRLTGTSLPGPRFSWMAAVSTYLTLWCEDVSVSIFVLGSRHIDESFAFGGQGLRGNSVDQRCAHLNSSTGPTCLVLSAFVQVLRRMPLAGFVAESLDHGWSRSCGCGNRSLCRGSRSDTCLPYFRAPDLRQGSLCKGRGLLGELGSSSGGQPPYRFFLRMTSRGTLKSCIF